MGILKITLDNKFRKAHEYARIVRYKIDVILIEFFSNGTINHS